MYGTLPIGTNPVLINAQPLQTLPLTVFSIPPIGLNHYTIRVKGFKLQVPLKYNGSMKINTCEKWIIKMHVYMPYYEKQNIFADGKKNELYLEIFQKYSKKSMDYISKVY